MAHPGMAGPSVGGLRLKRTAKVQWIELTVHWEDGDRYHVDAMTPERAILFLKELA